jgi:hypothetical protein
MLARPLRNAQKSTLAKNTHKQWTKFVWGFGVFCVGFTAVLVAADTACQGLGSEPLFKEVSGLVTGWNSGLY